MKYLFSALFGLIPGVFTALIVLIYNPLFDTAPGGAGPAGALALSVDGQNAVSVLQASSGYPWVVNRPIDTRSPEIAGVRSAVRVMLASAGSPDRVAYVARVSTLTRDGRPLFGELIEQSVWHVVVPGAGSFMVASEDDLWAFARRMILPFARGSDFQGKLSYDTTVGPETRGRARVVGISGSYRGLQGEAEFSQTVRHVALDTGVRDAEATLWVSF